MALEIAVVSDLYQAGLTADGEPAISEKYFVQAEAADGRRWVHGISFAGAGVVDGRRRSLPTRPDQREAAAAETLAGRVRAALATGQALNFSLWVAVDPRYGSEAYQALDAGGYFREMERKAEGF